MGTQSLVWFCIAVAACMYAMTLLYVRYVRRANHAVRSRGDFELFAVFMLLFALGAVIAGYASLQAGR